MVFVKIFLYESHFKKKKKRYGKKIAKKYQKKLLLLSKIVKKIILNRHLKMTVKTTHFLKFFLVEVIF